MFSENVSVKFFLSSLHFPWNIFIYLDKNPIKLFKNIGTVSFQLFGDWLFCAGLGYCTISNVEITVAESEAQSKVFAINDFEDSKSQAE